jgi:hypothetical protein
MEPDPQSLPPALVAFVLTSGRRPEVVLTRCLLSLAADGWLSIDAQDSGTPTVRILRLPDSPASIREFERVALDRVMRMTGSLTQVPLSALTDIAGVDDAPWRQRFRRAVSAEAIDAGLVSRGVRDAVALVVAGGVCLAGGIALAASGAVRPASAPSIAFAALIVITIVIKILGRPQLTAYGRTVDEWWRRNGGGLDGALVADRLPPGAVPSQRHSAEALVAGSAPLPPDQVWSAYGGHWHTVKIGSYDGPSRGKPKTAATLVVAGAFPFIPLAVMGDSIGGETGRLLPFGPVALAAALLLFRWLPAYLRRLRVPAHQELTGQVVKRWTYEDGDEDHRKTRFCCCIDDGASAEGLAFRIGRGQYKQIRTGELVSVSFNPRWHTVKRLQALAPASPAGR